MAPAAIGISIPSISPCGMLSVRASMTVRTTAVIDAATGISEHAI